ncbi:MAG: hypothetical protein PHE33_04465 [Bacteroidales bacterium]|nr:hypothetical protein [Bacteroidales bacterium]
MLLKKDLDFPAGHSMDSQWFAVDKDGNIGFFETGQSATMPIQFDLEGNWKDFIKEHTCKISKGLHKLVINESLVNDILSKCKEENVEKLVKNAEEDYFYFEGFIVLNDKVEWQDLMFEESLANDDYEFAILVSEDQKLYYISGVYDFEEIFISVLKAGKIKSCVMTDLSFPYDPRFNIEGLDMIYLGGYEYMSQEWSRLPYKRISNPENTLNISQLNPETLHKLVRFDNISFKDYPNLQPIEFIPCISYDLEVCDLENGYAKLILSDNETEASVAMSLEEWFVALFYACDICNPKKCVFELDSFYCRSKGENPRVILLRNIEYSQSNIDHIQNICSSLDIAVDDWYLTNCIKCKEKNGVETTTPINARFSNCAKNLEREIEIIQPLLIIVLDNESYENLKSYYQLPKGETGDCSFVTINNFAIPLIKLDISTSIDSPQLEKYKTLIKEFLIAYRQVTPRPLVREKY